MGVWEGLLGGFSERKAQVEAENRREAELASGREARVFEALLASPDPEIQSLAATGLLESARPRKRKGGLRGWMGELEQSPILGQIQSLIRTPVQTSEGTLPELAHTEFPTIPTPPPRLGEAPAGTPTQSLTEPGAAPAVTPQPRPAPRQIPARVGTPPSFEPRQVFATPESTALAQARAKAQGDVEGDIAGYMAAGMTRDAAVAQVRSERMRANAANRPQSIAGEIVGPDGRVTPAFGVFLNGQYVSPETGQPLAGFRPRSSTGSVSMGADREAMSRQKYGRPYAQLTQAEQADVNAALPTFAGQMAEARGLGSGRARVATELNMPIGPSNARLYNVSPTTTLQELANTVGLTDEQKDRLYATSQIDLLIQDIDALIPQVFPNVPEGIKGSIQTALSLGMQRFAADADLAKLDASINAALAQVAQLSGQPGSRLSDRDIDLAKSTLASLQPSLFGGDTINTARARVQVIKNLLEKAKGSIPTSPQVGTAPPAASPRPSATPPPSRGSTSGPAGWFVDQQGNLVQGAP